MGWIPDNVIAELQGSHQLGIFLHVATDPPLHLWFGAGDIPAGIDSVDPAGTTYYGGGVLEGVPSLEVLVNGTSDSVEFTLSGIDPAMGAKLIDSLPPVRGADVYLGLTTLDEYYQPMSSIIPIWKGKASHNTENVQPVMGTNNKVMTLGLTVTSGDDGRSRASRSTWTSAQQKAFSPTDKFCDQVSRLARGVNPVWPHYT